MVLGDNLWIIRCSNLLSSAIMRMVHNLLAIVKTTYALRYINYLRSYNRLVEGIAGTFSDFRGRERKFPIAKFHSCGLNPCCLLLAILTVPRSPISINDFFIDRRVCVHLLLLRWRLRPAFIFIEKACIVDSMCESLILGWRYLLVLASLRIGAGGGRHGWVVSYRLRAVVLRGVLWSGRRDLHHARLLLLAVGSSTGSRGEYH